MTGGGFDSYTTKVERNRARLAQGQCTHCRPNRGCCDGNERDGKWVSVGDRAEFRPSKDKRRK
jgi:hypothetical protein